MGKKLSNPDDDTAMSAQAGVGLLVSPSIAECVVDWVPLAVRKGLSSKAKPAGAISECLASVRT